MARFVIQSFSSVLDIRISDSFPSKEENSAAMNFTDERSTKAVEERPINSSNVEESAVVQVHEADENMCPNPSSVLILREIPESTPIKEIEELFISEKCPKFSECLFANNDCWYVKFNTNEETMAAYHYLREEAKSFNGKPVMVRYKASAPFSNIKTGAIQALSATNTPQEKDLYSPPNSTTPRVYTYTAAMYQINLHRNDSVLSCTRMTYHNDFSVI